MSAELKIPDWNFQQFVMYQYEIKKEFLSKISSESLIGYRSTLDREHEYYFGVLKGFLKTWIELGYSGIDESVGSLLDGWRLKGNTKGLAVQTLCPKKRPIKV